MSRQPHSGGSVGPLVDRLFRREYGRMTAWLIGWLGAAEAGMAADIIQEAMVRALKSWPWRGIPDNPEAWLWRTARNIAIDRVRTLRPVEPVDKDFPDADPPDEGALADAELSLLFLCADDALPADTSVPLTLKLACGFGDLEIAGALSVKPAAIRQRIVRAKQAWRQAPPRLDLGASDLDRRCAAVLNVIYLMLNEGYGGHNPEHWQRDELCREATRLALLAAGHHRIDRPEADALAALCLFTLARLDARTGGGEIILLPDQDRSLWNRRLISEGFRWLQRAGRGTELSPYHLLAGIASCHAAAPDYAATDWNRLLRYYDQLIERDPGSPFHHLNRAIALAEGGRVAEARDAMARLESEPRLAATYLLPAARSWIRQRCGESAEARRDLVLAIARAPSEPVRNRLRERLNAMGDPANMET